MTEEELQKGRERWLDVVRMHSLYLKHLYVESQMHSTLLVEILAKLKGKEFNQIKASFEARRKTLYKEVNDWIFAEFGEIDLRDILPPDKTDNPEA